MNQNEALVKSAIHDAVIRAVTEISADVKGLLKDALARETNETAKSMLRSMVDNLSIAKEGDKAVCQSPGYPTTWLSFGDGNLPECTREAISEAVAEATKKGYLRPSMVDPLTRENSGNNTGKGVPNIEYEYHPGQKYVDFIISFKGCGAELGNAMQIMTTAKLGKNLSGLKRFILETAVNAGGKPCPPYGIGIGIGGQMDIAAKLSRKAISTRRWDDVNPDPELAALEAGLKDAINGLGLGAGGCPGICGGGGDRCAGHRPPCAGQVFRPRRGQCGRGGAVCGPPPLRARGGRQRAGPEGGRPHRRTGGGVHRHRRQRSVRRGRVGPGAGHGHHRPGSGQGGVRRPAGGKAGGLCQ